MLLSICSNNLYRLKSLTFIILFSFIDFQGEIDFDLRKSEEIASIPLEEDCSFNLWGSGSPLLANTPSPPVAAAASTDTSEPVLLNDCWWFEFDREKVVGKLASSKPTTLTTTSTSSTRNNLASETQCATAIVKEEVIDTKENMNPITAPQPLLSDPIKMAELQLRLERIASHTHPGVNSKAKAADLMKILQEQIAGLNKKKYRSPAAVSDLHNFHSKELGLNSPSTSVVESQTLFAQPAVSSAPMMSGNANDIFHSDPFDGLFSSPDVQMHQVGQSVGSQLSGGNESSHPIIVQNLTVAPLFVSSNLHQQGPEEGTAQVASSGHTFESHDLFSEAHQEIMRQSTKVQQSHVEPQHLNQMLIPASQSQTFHTMHPVPQVSNNQLPVRANLTKNFVDLTLQLPSSRGNMPELDLNFDALLFGTPGSAPSCSKVPAISTPEVLKPLVETPDPESFDLLSYLCDVSMNLSYYLVVHEFHGFNLLENVSINSVFLIICRIKRALRQYI